MREAGLEEVEAYVLRKQNMVERYIEARPIMGLCEYAVQILGTWVTKK